MMRFDTWMECLQVMTASCERFGRFLPVTCIYCPVFQHEAHRPLAVKLAVITQILIQSMRTMLSDS